MMDLNHQPYTNKWTEAIKKALYDNDDVMSFIWYDTDFLNPEYAGKYKYINNILLNSRSKMYKAMTGNAEIPVNKEEDRSLAAESFSCFLMANKWSQNKQVYKFDAELELSLTDTEEIILPVRVLDRLPFNTFYIDFADDGIFKSNFHGAIVNIVPERCGYFVYVERIKEDGRAMFGNIALIPKEADGTFFFSKSDIIVKNDADRNKDWKEFGIFLLNALLYLCADNAEIRESLVTKTTYRPSKTIKNKFSEVKQWECGYRYGATVRKQKKEISEAKPKQKSETIGDIKIKIRKAIPAHTRRAHWHHYWKGPKDGERTLILHWIAPIYVSGQAQDTAVIHMVK